MPSCARPVAIRVTKAMDSADFHTARPLHPPAVLLTAPDIEKTTVACLCQFPTVAIPYIRERASFGEFTVPSLSTIYQTALDLFEDVGGFDLFTLQERLRANETLAAVGGEAFVTSLWTANTPPSALEYYTGILRERFANRQLAQLAARLARGAGNLDELSGLASDAERTLAAIRAGISGDATALLVPRLFDASNPPPEPHAVWKLRGAPVATPGNLQALQAKAKAGKTAVLGAMQAAVLGSKGDCFTFESENPLGLAVVHFDTEQSPYDHHRCITRSLRRAELDAAPKWFLSYHIADLPLPERKRLVKAEMHRAAAAHHGLLAVIIDGIGDLCADPNNPEEAFALVDELHQLAIKHATCIVCVLHENPGSESGKTRGHLGSQLERKAETNIRLEKDAHGVTVMFADRARHAHIPKSNGVKFAWDDEAKMHLTTSEPFGRKDTASGEQSPERKNDALPKAKDALISCFKHGASIRHNQAARQSRLKESTFAKYWRLLREKQLIEEAFGIPGLWQASRIWTAELPEVFASAEDGPTAARSADASTDS